MASPNEQAPADVSNTSLSQELQQYLIDANVYESSSMNKQREEALRDLRSVLEQSFESFNVVMFIFGSYSLEVHGPGSDIDVLCVTPNHYSRFEIFNRLEGTLARQTQVTELLSIPGARVPVIKFKFSGVSIDLVFAITSLPETPNSLNPMNMTLEGMDPKSISSLNGYKNIEQIKAVVNENMESYRTALRCLKLWAKSRDIYSNIVGYFGGVNLALLLCLVVNECARPLQSEQRRRPLPSELVSRFFNLYSNWHWPSPVKPCRMDIAHIAHIAQTNYNLTDWDPINSQSKLDLMPIITPVFPSINSSYNVSPSTLTIIKQEIQRAQIICQDIMARKKTWSDLFEYSPFFSAYKNYFQIDIRANNADNFRTWKGWIESRLRIFIQQIENNTKLGLHAHLHPRDFMDPSNSEDVGYKCYFYVGLRRNERIAMQEGQEFDLTQVAFEFRHAESLRFTKWDRKDMHIYITYINARAIPDFVLRSDKGKRKRNSQPRPADNDAGNESEKRAAVSPTAGDKPISSPVKS